MAQTTSGNKRNFRAGRELRRRETFPCLSFDASTGRQSPNRAAIVFGCAVVCAVVFARQALAKEDGKELPSFREVTTVVEGHFSNKQHWLPGDLISQTDAQEVFGILERLGWIVKSKEAISHRVLADASFLVQQLGSKTGKKFMRRVANYPQGYDRLDRLGSVSGGRKLVSDLVLSKGGYELIEYLSTTRGGKNLGRMLKSAKQGDNLNRPTGKIYTARHFLAALRMAYDDEKKGTAAETTN